MTTIHTIERLKALQPGEAMVYYRGDLPADIARNVKEAPHYADALAAIQKAAADLSANGGISLSVSKIVRAVTFYRKSGERVTEKIRLNEYRAAWNSPTTDKPLSPPYRADGIGNSQAREDIGHD